MTNVITESGMDFIADNCFHIEQSPLYTESFRQQKIKSVEFIRSKGNDLLLVEAKTTFPNPDNPSEDNKIKFKLGVEEICDKFIHSLNMFSSVKAGIADTSFLADFMLPDKSSLCFVLVIKDHKKEWCKPIQAGIMENLPYHIKIIWKPRIWVINHEDAIKYCLVYPAK